MRTYLHALRRARAARRRRSDARAATAAASSTRGTTTSSALGFPDYRLDVPAADADQRADGRDVRAARASRCATARVEHDLERRRPRARPSSRAPRSSRSTPPKGDVAAAAFAPRFDVLHRTFLGYPASLAPPQRMARFYAALPRHRGGPRQGRAEVALHARRGRLGGRLLRPRPSPRVPPLLRIHRGPAMMTHPTHVPQGALAAGAASAVAGLPTHRRARRRRRAGNETEFFVFVIAARRLGRHALGRPAQRDAGASSTRRRPRTPTRPVEALGRRAARRAGSKTFELVRPHGIEPRLRPGHRRARRPARPHHGRQRPRDEHGRAPGRPGLLDDRTAPERRPRRGVERRHDARRTSWGASSCCRR